MFTLLFTPVLCLFQTPIDHLLPSLASLDHLSPISGAPILRPTSPHLRPDDPHLNPLTPLNPLLPAMGLPGTAEREMSSVAQADNQSPASAEDSTNNKNNNGEGSDNKEQQAKMVSAEQSKTTPEETPIMTNNETNKASSGPASAAGEQDQLVDVINSTSSSGGMPLKPPTRPDPEPGLRDRLKRFRSQVITALFKHPKSVPFREPVNAKALGIFPIYHQVIKNPMDLGTVRKKIDRAEYNTRAECVSDVEQVWHNAMTFNAPGHFVFEAAKLLQQFFKDKLARLEKDEADGVFEQLKLEQQQKASKAAQEVREPRKRVTRKVSTDLPGESAQPQQLKKKYVENLSEQMKQCDGILKELITVKAHQRYVEPFLKRNPKNKGGESMDLYRIQSRLQQGHYSHPLQFANDFRKVVTDTYRDPTIPQEDPVVTKAQELQHNFETRFAKIDFEPVHDPAMLELGEDAAIVLQLKSSLGLVKNIMENVNILVRDLPKVMSYERRKKVGKGAPRQRKRTAGGGARSRAGPAKGVSPKKKAVMNSKTPTSAAAANKRKRGRPPGQTGTAGGGPATKKPRTTSPKKKAPPVPAQTMSVEESMALRQEVGTLSEDQQQHIVQIMLDNHETLCTDANGYTEIDLGNCSAKTVKEVQQYVKRAKAKASAPAAGNAKKRASPAKKQQQKKNKNNGNLSDSSDSGEDSDDSSSDEDDEDSSSSDSDSD